jgi:lipoprotein-releasing system ATP-binding protein
MSASSPVLEGRDLWMSYASGSGRISVLEGVSCAVPAGSSLSVTGESGCGKTTLLNLLAGLERPDRGAVCWAGEPIGSLGAGALARRRGAFIGMVFQSFYLVPEIDALDNVLLPARILGGPVRAARERARALLGRVGLGDRERHLPAQLSGGERQRVAVARALVNAPRVVLADEPTGNLDEATGEAVMDLLLAVCAEQAASLVLVTHNPVHAARTAIHLRLARHRLDRGNGAPPAPGR